MAKVCFVLTVYNKEAWIARTLSSIVKQTLKDIEIVVWDDGSTDDTMKVVKFFAKKDKRFILGGTKKNYGISRAYNRAHKLITAPYVCISSGDDLYHAKRAQLTCNYFDSHPEKSIVYGDYVRVRPDGKPLEYKKVLPYYKEALFEPNNQYIPHGFMSVRKEVLLKVPYDEKLRFGIDYPWLKELANTYEPYQWGRIKAVQGYYMWIKTNVSHTHRAEIWSQDNNKKYIEGG